MGRLEGARGGAVEGRGRQGTRPRSTSTVRFGERARLPGSVVPIFRRQIAAGGPVTVTDRRMTRYFMTIPEAVQLIIRAGSLGDASGEVYVLEMGEPIPDRRAGRDDDSLSGLEPETDIAIEIVGARPGEKVPRGALQPLRAPATDAGPEDRVQRSHEPLGSGLSRAHVRGDQSARARRRCCGAREACLDVVRRTKHPAPEAKAPGSPRRLPRKTWAPSRSLSVHHFISSVGADAGFAAIIGLAILVLPYFRPGSRDFIAAPSGR